MSLRVEMLASAELLGRLDRYGRGLDDWLEVWPEVADAFAQREEIWFDREGEGTWPQLSDDYREWKAVHYPGQPILVREGDLRESLTDPDKVVLGESATELLLGSSDPVAKYHDKGTRRMADRRTVIPVIRLAGAFANLLQRHASYPPGFR
jgi:phage gpG-like protein